MFSVVTNNQRPSYLKTHFPSQTTSPVSDWIGELSSLVNQKPLDLKNIKNFRVKFDNGIFTRNPAYLEFIKLFLYISPLRPKGNQTESQLKAIFKELLSFGTIASTPSAQGEYWVKFKSGSDATLMQICMTDKAMGCFVMFKAEDNYIGCKFVWNLLNHEAENFWTLSLDVFQWQIYKEGKRTIPENFIESYIDIKRLKHTSAGLLYSEVNESFDNLFKPNSAVQIASKIMVPRFERRYIAITFPLKEKQQHLFELFNFQRNQLSTKITPEFTSIADFFKYPVQEELLFKSDKTWLLNVADEVYPYSVEIKRADSRKKLTITQYCADWTRELKRIHVYFKRQGPSFLEFIELQWGGFDQRSPYGLNLKFYPSSDQNDAKIQAEIGYFDNGLLNGQRFKISKEANMGYENPFLNFLFSIVSSLNSSELFAGLGLSHQIDGWIKEDVSLNPVGANFGPLETAMSTLHTLRESQDFPSNPTLDITLKNNIPRIIHGLRIEEQMLHLEGVELEARSIIIGDYQRTLSDHIYLKFLNLFSQRELIKRRSVEIERENGLQFILTDKKADLIRLEENIKNIIRKASESILERLYVQKKAMEQKYHHIISLIITEDQARLSIIRDAQMSEDILDLIYSEHTSRDERINKFGRIKEILCERFTLGASELAVRERISQAFSRSLLECIAEREQRLEIARHRVSEFKTSTAHFLLSIERFKADWLALQMGEQAARAELLGESEHLFLQMNAKKGLKEAEQSARTQISEEFFHYFDENFRQREGFFKLRTEGYSSSDLYSFGERVRCQVENYITVLNAPFPSHPNSLSIFDCLFFIEDAGWDVFMGGSAARGCSWANDLDIKIAPKRPMTNEEQLKLFIMLQGLLQYAHEFRGEPDKARMSFEIQGLDKPVNIVLYLFHLGQYARDPLYNEDVVVRFKRETHFPLLSGSKQHTTDYEIQPVFYRHSYESGMPQEDEKIDLITVAKIIFTQTIHPKRDDVPAFYRVLRDIVCFSETEKTKPYCQVKENVNKLVLKSLITKFNDKLNTELDPQEKNYRYYLATVYEFTFGQHKPPATFRDKFYQYLASYNLAVAGERSPRLPIHNSFCVGAGHLIQLLLQKYQSQPNEQHESVPFMSSSELLKYIEIVLKRQNLGEKELMIFRDFSARMQTVMEHSSTTMALKM